MLSGGICLKQSMVDDAHQGNRLVNSAWVHAGFNLLHTTLLVEIGCHGLTMGCECFLESVNGLEIVGAHNTLLANFRLPTDRFG